MRRVLVGLIAAFSLSVPAAAEPGQEFAEWASELRVEAVSRANIAASAPAAPALPLDVEDPFYFEMEAFVTDALRLSRLVADNDGPQDLQCIFRGMSNDAAARLEALNAAERRSDQARTYRAIANLMRDAMQIAPAVDEEVMTETGLPECRAGGG